jgi:hypothetical protein
MVSDRSHHKISSPVFRVPKLIGVQATHAHSSGKITEMILKCDKAVGGIDARLPSLLGKIVSIVFVQQ